MQRFYYEQDGDAPKGSSANSHYIIDRYADPLGNRRRTDIPSMDSGAAMRRLAIRTAAAWNENPPWPIWDTIQAERDAKRERQYRMLRI